MASYLGDISEYYKPLMNTYTSKGFTAPTNTNWQYSQLPSQSYYATPKSYDYSGYSQAYNTAMGQAQNYLTNYYTPQATTGQIGGMTYAQQPALNKYEASPIQQTLTDWTSGLAKMWESTFKSTPFWQSQTAQAEPAEPMFRTGSFAEGGVTEGMTKPDIGFRVSPPYEAPEGAGTPERIFENRNMVSPEMFQTQLTNISEQGNDDVLLRTAQLGIESNMELPVSPQRLDAVQSTGVLKELWNIGYKAPKVFNAAINGINQSIKEISSQIGVDLSDNIEFNPEQISMMKYIDIINARADLEKLLAFDGAKIEANDSFVYLDTTFTDEVGATGDPVLKYKGWKQVTPYKEKEETTTKKTKQEELLERQEEANLNYEFYWKAEQIAQRNKQREESWEWSHNKNLEGYAEFFDIMDELKINPEADQYFKTQFDELRLEWETSGSGLSWEEWLRQYDFMGEWYSRSPYKRGERPATFAPRMRTVAGL